MNVKHTKGAWCATDTASISPQSGLRQRDGGPDSTTELFILDGGFKTPTAKVRVDFRHEDGISGFITPRCQLVTVGAREATRSGQDS